jgi:hypothetical protein
VGISFSKRQEEKQEEEQTRAAEHRDCSSIKRETIPQIFITLCISSFFLLLYKGLVTIESAHQASGCTPPTRRLAIDLGNGHPIKPRAIRRQEEKIKKKEKKKRSSWRIFVGKAPRLCSTSRTHLKTRQN